MGEDQKIELGRILFDVLDELSGTAIVMDEPPRAMLDGHFNLKEVAAEFIRRAGDCGLLTLQQRV